MLLGQDFSRRHQRTLPASVDAQCRRQCCHHGFAGADIALQQPVHRYRPAQVMGNLGLHPALRPGQGKRQSRQQALGQRRTGTRVGRQRWCPQARACATGLQLRQLLRQQFLGLEPLPGRVAAVLQCRQRHIGRGIMQK